MNLIIFRYLNNFTGHFIWLDYFFIFLAEYLPWVLIAALAYYLFQRKKQLRFPILFLSISLAGFLSWALASLIKYNYLSARPFIALPNIKPLFISGGWDSFPSAHSALFFGLGMALYLKDKKKGILFLSISFLMAIARVIVGVHWPLDILGGICLGVTVALSINILGKKRSNC